jgi:hypothetical protein
VAFIILIWLLIQTTPVQNWLVTRVTVKLSKDLNTKVSIKHVDFELFNTMLLQGALVFDKKQDTLLYAGTAKVNITDWFFIKDNIVLKYIGLQDGVINLNRKDSVWNYAFLVDYFSGPSKKKDTSKVIKLDLKMVEMERFRIFQKDEWIGQDMILSLNRLNIATNEFDMRQKIIRIGRIDLDKPLFYQYNYTGTRPPRPPKLKTTDENILPVRLEWNKDNWLFSIKNIVIANGNFVMGRQAKRPYYENRFDEKNINFKNINGNINNLLFLQDTLTADVNIATKERSGFEIKKLSTAFHLDPGVIEFAKLDLITAKSHLKNYYAMHYDSLNSDMANFIYNVELEGNLKNSTLNSDDLAFFAPDAKNWKRTFTLNGQVKGTIDNLSGKNIVMASGKDNYLRGDLALRGLPDINSTYINLNAKDLHTSYNELANLVPALKDVTTPYLPALGNINFKGSFTGFTKDFVTYGILTSNLGTIQTDISFKFPDNKPPVYYGRLLTNNLNVGKLLRNDQLGTISFSGTLSGNGFTASEMDIAVDGTLRQLMFNGYNYQNIITRGNLASGLFQGFVSVDDPNLKIDGLVGEINFKLKEPQFNVEADVSAFHPKALHFTNDNFSLTGKFNLDFSGNNIDNFLGSAIISNAVLMNDDKKLSFDSLSINSFYEDGKKFLTLQTNEVDASITGNFKILELPDAFQLFLNRYYPAYINKPRKNLQDQDFVFNIKTKNIGEYISLIDSKLKGFDNSEINGELNLSQNSLDVSTSVPSFSYGPTTFVNAAFTASGSYDTLNFISDIEDVIINDSLNLPGSKITVVANNDISDITIKTSASKTLTEADLSARVQTLSDGFKLYFNPSSFVINDKKWTLEKGGELLLSKKLLSASEVKFVQGNQELTISTEPSATSSANDVVFNLKKIDIGDIVPFIFKNPKLEGQLTGNIKVEDPFNNLAVEFDTHVEKLMFNNDSIGLIKTNGSYYASSGDLLINASSTNELYDFTSAIIYRAKDTSESQLSGTLHLNEAKVHLLDRYLSDIFSGVDGDAAGQLNISGKAKAPRLTGSINLNNTTLTVNYTKCRYILQDNSIINFNAGEIDFGLLKLKDTLKNTATFTGKLYHNFFNNFFFNELNFKTDRPNGNLGKFVLLNTTAKDNNQFYGNIIGDAELSINGPVNDMRMVISGQPTDSSHIYLPTGETVESGKIDYLEFIKFGREMRSDATFRQSTNIKVDMDIVATPYAKIDVILDETTQDIIKAQGNGKLNISVGTRDPLTIRGRYDVTEGQYTFNFQTFLKTPFSLQSGFIEWQGDPYLANLNIDALYKAENVDLSAIPTSSGRGSGRGDVDIIFKLRGTLKEPRPDFEFQFTFDNPLKVDPIANEFLKTRFQADQNELNKQVTSLLLFNTFLFSDEQRLFSTNNTGNFVTRSLGQILSNTLSSSLNNWLQKLLKTNQVNLYTNINTSDFNFERGITQKQIQNLGNFGFKTSFLKNRLLLNLGGNVDYRLIQNSGNSNTNFLFTPDVSFEYLVTPDGKLRVVGFNKSDAGIGDIVGITRRNRTGVLLSYRRDFNSFSEFFGGAKRLNNE